MQVISYIIRNLLNINLFTCLEDGGLINFFTEFIKLPIIFISFTMTGTWYSPRNRNKYAGSLGF